MPFNNKTILITGEVDASLIKKMQANGFVADVIPFTQTKPIKSKTIQEKIQSTETLDATVVFTSSNAAEAVACYIQNRRPHWKIYCVGNATKSAVEKIFGKESVRATAKNAKELSRKIIADNIQTEVYFFCGDKRRDELPQLLGQYNICLHEIEVYATTILYHKLEKNYDAVIFFSPSAAEGFFKRNVLHEKTVLFAIGQTTAAEIMKLSQNKTLVSDEPDKEKVIQKVIDYFKAAL